MFQRDVQQLLKSAMRVFAGSFDVRTSMKPGWDCQAVLFGGFWILAVGQGKEQPRVRDLAVS
eukprot:11635257-Alexandrium_andersonii.AAC.1